MTTTRHIHLRLNGTAFSDSSAKKSFYLFQIDPYVQAGRDELGDLLFQHGIRNFRFWWKTTPTIKSKGHIGGAYIEFQTEDMASNAWVVLSTGHLRIRGRCLQVQQIKMPGAFRPSRDQRNAAMARGFGFGALTSSRSTQAPTPTSASTTASASPSTSISEIHQDDPRPVVLWSIDTTDAPCDQEKTLSSEQSLAPASTNDPNNNNQPAPSGRHCCPWIGCRYAGAYWPGLMCPAPTGE